MYDEGIGVRTWLHVCAFPHKPLLYCTAPGDAIKRCINFEEDVCETDPLAILMRCSIDFRPCPTPQQCDIAGVCTDTYTGLSWTLPDTCVVTPVNDAMVEDRCDENLGLCFFRMDPPFGMEVRKLHDLLDLLEPESAKKDAKPDFMNVDPELQGKMMFPPAGDPDQLRTSGRLNSTECRALGASGILPPGHVSIFLERARTGAECERWQGCCLSVTGDRCNLFSGQVYDRYDSSTRDVLEYKKEECTLCGGEWKNVFKWKASGGWDRGTMKDSKRWWYERKFTSVNSWAEVVDIGAIREVLENALQSRIGHQRQNAVLCLLDPLLVALETVAAAVEAPESSPLIPLDFPLLPSPRFRVGSTVAVGGVVSHASFGDIELAWHDLSTSTEDLGFFNVKYSVSVEPFELGLGMAAAQLPLPGRAEMATSRLLRHVLAPDGTTTPLPPPNEIYRVGPMEGYPAWLMNQMLEMEGGEAVNAAEKERQTQLILGAEQRAKVRAEMRERAKASANIASGLPNSSKNLLLGILPTNDYRKTPLSEIFSGACRSGVTTPLGEIVGQLLGDCVTLEADADLVNGVELCVPLQFPGDVLMNTEIGQYSGIMFDFAKQGTVPTNYSMALPPEIPKEAGEIPGEVAAALWEWPSHPEWGRLKPGVNTFRPLGLLTWKRKDDTQLCARIMEAGWTYCPIARLNCSFYDKLPRKPGHPQFPSPDSSCPAMDAVLAPIQDKHLELKRTEFKYVQLDYSASFAPLMNDEQNYKDFRARQADLKGLGCPAGMNLVFKDGSYRCT